jgi:hypothetical protein
MSIKMFDAFKYYKGTPGQVEAIAFLEKLLTEEDRLKFQELYRKPNPKPTTPPAIYLYVKWSGHYDEEGLKIFGMYLMNGDKVVDKVAVCSGQSYAQDTPWPLDDYSGSMRPCPEGVYDLGAVDDIGYDPGSSDGFGQWVIPLNPRAAIKRSALQIHSDRNRATSPGSAGCLCPYDVGNMQKVVAWCMAKARPTYCIVDHGTGFLKKEGVSVPSLGK